MVSIQIPGKTAFCEKKTSIIGLLFKNVCIDLASNSGILTTVPSSVRQYSTVIKDPGCKLRMNWDQILASSFTSTMTFHKCLKNFYFL